MANYLSDRTGASIDTVLDNADEGNIGKTTIPSITQDYDTITETGFFTPSNSSPNAPATTRGVLINMSGESLGHAGQIHIGSDTGKINFRSKFSVYRPWKELYATDGSKTSAQIDTVLDNADAGGIGSLTGQTGDGPIGFNSFVKGNPFDGIFAGHGINCSFDAGSEAQLIFQAGTSPRAYIRSRSVHAFGTKQELYHTGNTGTLEFGGSSGPQGVDRISITPSGTSALSLFENNTVSSQRAVSLLNPNGLVGTIQTSGTSTSYNTSSDPRLKDFKDAPTDSAINDKFDDLFGTFKTFNWKNDSDGELIWGFDAHATIDAGLDLGSEGEGPRDLNLGDVYETTPAVFEDKEQPVVYKTGEKKGEQKLYADGEPVMETVQVEITAAIEKKVSPAGVDQSKAVPILLAKIEQLERRLTAAGL